MLGNSPTGENSENILSLLHLARQKSSIFLDTKGESASVVNLWNNVLCIAWIAIMLKVLCTCIFLLSLWLQVSLDKGDRKDRDLHEDLWFELSDETLCNWMMFVRPAQNHLEQNLVAYQYGHHVYYTTIKNVEPKQELKVPAGLVVPLRNRACFMLFILLLLLEGGS